MVRAQLCRRKEREREGEKENAGRVGKKSGKDGEKWREKRERELVEARCTPQSRPGCLVARSNQT